MPAPSRPPQTDAVLRLREVEEFLREVEVTTFRTVDRCDLRELQEIVGQPHIKVSSRYSFKLQKR